MHITHINLVVVATTTRMSVKKHNRHSWSVLKNRSMESVSEKKRNKISILFVYITCARIPFTTKEKKLCPRGVGKIQPKYYTSAHKEMNH